MPDPPADLPSTPPSDPTASPSVTSVTAAPRASDVPIKPYVHMQQRLDEFMKEHPDGVYFHTDVVDKDENESAIRSLDPKTPVFVTSKKTFTAAELQSMGFEVFYNGKGGKLVGIRVK
jgi:hypothetical protein